MACHTGTILNATSLKSYRWKSSSVTLPTVYKNYPHSWWVTPHSRWGTSVFPVIHTPIPGEDVYSLLFILIRNTHLHQEWGCALPRMEMWLTGNVHPHWEWGCASPGMHILIGNKDTFHHFRVFFSVHVYFVFARLRYISLMIDK